MAVLRPGKKPAAKPAKVKDLDNAIAREHGKKPSLNRKERAAVQNDRRDKPAARKPGRIADSASENESEHVAEKDHLQEVDRSSAPQQQKQTKKKIAKKTKLKQATSQERDSSKDHGDQEAEPETFSVQGLASEQRVNMARSRGFQQTPAVSDYMLAKQEVSTGQGLAEALQHIHAKPATPEEDSVEPEEFLSAFESMKDVYVKTHGRASPKTAQLLESPDLEDMIQMLQELLATDGLRLSAEARIKSSIYQKLRDEPGPLLLGLNDARLNEAWNLFSEGWDIWEPEIESDLEDAEASGVELFWEGEAENSAGQEIEIIQTLSFTSNCVKLATQFGDDTDELSFDGSTFFRLTKR